MQLGFLSLQKKIPPRKPSHRTTQKKPIKRISGKLGHREQRNCFNGGTTPRGSRVAARFDFASPRLVLGPHYTTPPGRDRSPMCSHPSLTVAAKWINCRQTRTVQVALAGPGTLVTLVAATSCNFMQPLVVGTYHQHYQVPVFRAALAVLWLALHRDKFPYSWCDSRTQGLRQYCLDSLGRLWAIDNGKQHLQVTVHVTCSTSTRRSWQIIPTMGRKKVDRRRHRAELVNQVLLLFFDVFVLHFENDCTMHDALIWRAAIK